jgi:periplasmic divalent cation tolerance protein
MTNDKPVQASFAVKGSGELNSPEETGFVLIYTTMPDEAQALKLGQTLVEKRLVGCVNILPGMTAIYVWQEQLETAREAVLIAKLPAAGAEVATSAIRQAHPYDTPAILVLPIIAGDERYLKWLSEGVTLPSQ